MSAKLDLHVELEREGDSELFDDLQRYLTRHPTLTRFFFNPAGFVFLFGLILSLGMILGWVGIWLVDGAQAGSVAAVAGLEIAAGREVAIPAGLQEYGLPALLVFGISSVQDLVTTTYIYPAFYFFRKHNLGRQNFFGYFFERMAKKAERNKPFIERYGAAGLFLFMLIPFAVNGPLIGAIIGKLAGIRTRYILPTVILSTFTATAAWTALWVYTGPRVEAFTESFGGEKYVSYAMYGIVVIVLLGTVIGFLRDLRRFRRIKAHRERVPPPARHDQTLYAQEAEAPPAAKSEPPPGP